MVVKTLDHISTMTNQQRVMMADLTAIDKIMFWLAVVFVAGPVLLSTLCLLSVLRRKDRP